MFITKKAYSSFSVDTLETAQEFYTKILGLKVEDNGMGLEIHLPGGGMVFAYPKDTHQPASFTLLNFVVDNIDTALEELKSRGVHFEYYKDMPQDEKGILRGLSQNRGPSIAWFKDSAGNILSILQEK